MASIRITSVPPGEAPAAIREAWVGLELPLYRKNPGRFLGSGVLSGPRSVGASLIRLLTFRSTLHHGYVVLSLAGIEVLERSNPTAARWWRENTPHLFHTRRYLIFPAECCKLVE
jgi:hypothetical protein